MAITAERQSSEVGSTNLQRALLANADRFTPPKTDDPIPLPFFLVLKIMLVCARVLVWPEMQAVAQKKQCRTWWPPDTVDTLCCDTVSGLACSPMEGKRWSQGLVQSRPASSPLGGERAKDLCVLAHDDIYILRQNHF